MKIYVDSSIAQKYSFDFEHQIISLLKYVPEAHLDKLESIKVLNKSLIASNGKNCRGLYYGGGKNGASILLSSKALFDRMPGLFFCVPAIPKFILANTLYHEIGHHYLAYFLHGIKKGEKERYAQRYAISISRKAFKNYLWLFLLFFWPFLLLRAILKKIGNW